MHRGAYTLAVCTLASLAGCKTAFRVGYQPRADKALTCSGQMQTTTPTRLLTRTEYNHTVRDLLGDTTEPANNFPPEPLAFGFDNNADVYQATTDSITQYMQAGELLASTAVTTQRDRLVQCDNGVEDATCGSKFIAAVGQRLFRRPLTSNESTALNTYFKPCWRRRARFDTALNWTLDVMLESPQFLYRISRATPIHDAAAKAHGLRAATRLSYFLWTSTPDAATRRGASRRARHRRRLRRADRSHDPGPEVSRQHGPLLRAVAHGRRPGRHHQRSRHLSELSRPRSAQLVEAVADVVSARRHEQRRHARGAAHRAAHVAQSAARQSVRHEHHRAELRPGPTNTNERIGLLGQPGWLALLASPDQSSPVRRGVFVLRNLLCVQIGQPPANANIVPPPPKPGSTTRQRFDQHAQSAACSGCHNMIDPIGFAMEHFDGVALIAPKTTAKTSTPLRP